MVSNKRDISDGSEFRNGEDSRKVREDYDNINFISDDTFTDVLSPPCCAKLLVHCLRNIERQLNQLYPLYNDTKNLQIKGEKQLHTVAESLEFLSTKFDTLEKERDKQKEVIHKFEENIEKFEERSKSLVESVDNLEQYLYLDQLSLSSWCEGKKR